MGFPSLRALIRLLPASVLCGSLPAVGSAVARALPTAAALVPLAHAPLAVGGTIVPRALLALLPPRPVAGVHRGSAAAAGVPIVLGVRGCGSRVRSSASTLTMVLWAVVVVLRSPASSAPVLLLPSLTARLPAATPAPRRRRRVVEVLSRAPPSTPVHGVVGLLRPRLLLPRLLLPSPLRRRARRGLLPVVLVAMLRRGLGALRGNSQVLLRAASAPAPALLLLKLPCRALLLTWTTLVVMFPLAAPLTPAVGMTCIAVLILLPLILVMTVPLVDLMQIMTIAIVLSLSLAMLHFLGFPPIDLIHIIMLVILLAPPIVLVAIRSTACMLIMAMCILARLLLVVTLLLFPMRLLVAVAKQVDLLHRMMSLVIILAPLLLVVAIPPIVLMGIILPVVLARPLLMVAVLPIALTGIVGPPFLLSVVSSLVWMPLAASALGPGFCMALGIAALNIVPMHLMALMAARPLRKRLYGMAAVPLQIARLLVASSVVLFALITMPFVRMPVRRSVVPAPVVVLPPLDLLRSILRLSIGRFLVPPLAEKVRIPG